MSDVSDSNGEFFVLLFRYLFDIFCRGSGLESFRFLGGRVMDVVWVVRFKKILVV